MHDHAAGSRHARPTSMGPNSLMSPLHTPIFRHIDLPTTCLAISRPKPRCMICDSCALPPQGHLPGMCACQLSLYPHLLVPAINNITSVQYSPGVRCLRELKATSKPKMPDSVPSSQPVTALYFGTHRAEAHRCNPGYAVIRLLVVYMPEYGWCSSGQGRAQHAVLNPVLKKLLPQYPRSIRSWKRTSIRVPPSTEHAGERTTTNSARFQYKGETATV
jgi:hypothetical protein